MPEPTFISGKSSVWVGRLGGWVHSCNAIEFARSKILHRWETEVRCNFEVLGIWSMNPKQRLIHALGHTEDICRFSLNFSSFPGHVDEAPKQASSTPILKRRRYVRGEYRCLKMDLITNDSGEFNFELESSASALSVLIICTPPSCLILVSFYEQLLVKLWNVDYFRPCTRIQENARTRLYFGRQTAHLTPRVGVLIQKRGGSLQKDDLGFSFAISVSTSPSACRIEGQMTEGIRPVIFDLSATNLPARELLLCCCPLDCTPAIPSTHPQRNMEMQNTAVRTTVTQQLH
jgi:hypothetical protein